MSTLVLELQFIDNVTSIDREFDSLEAVLKYLNGQREDDFEWLCLHDNNTDIVLEGWSDIHQYISENTGPVLPVHELDANAWDYIAKETAHLRGIMNDLSVCGPACNCINCNPSKTLCNASCDVQEQTNPVTSLDSYSSQIERFSDLPDGAYFMCVGPHTSTRIFQKVMEDGEHNAVWVDHAHIGELIPSGMQVIRTNK